jgi:hypothetical protein
MPEAVGAAAGAIQDVGPVCDRLWKFILPLVLVLVIDLLLLLLLLPLFRRS